MIGRGHLTIVLVAMTVVAGLAPLTEAGDETATPAQAERALDLVVINKETKEPIPGVELSIRIVRQRRKDKTDKDGRCKIVLGEKEPQYLRIEVAKEGFVPMRLAWSQGIGRPKIPSQYTLALERGTSIGGIVQDEQGKPIEGVSVYLLVASGDEVERVAIWDHAEKTDADGHWRCDIVPAKLDDIAIRLAHPDYISDAMYGMTPRPTIEKLRAMTGVMVMKQGLNVTGRVCDVNDRPIEGASVAQGSDRFGSNYPSTKTDSEGRFEFGNAKQDEMVLTVQAQGYAPDLKHVTIYKPMKPIEFRLEPGHTLRGRIVDTRGNPVAGVFVSANAWRGHRSLDWRVDTDAEGRFQWNDAPADAVLFDMSKKGHMSVRGFAMSPSEQEYEITMPTQLKISGTVVDAETGEPVADFKVLSGIDRGEGRPVSWQRRTARKFTEGHYETSFTYPYPAHLIRIEADGYDPETSRPFASDEGEVTFDFKLKKGTGPAGIIHLRDGRPAPGAEVILCTPSQGVYIRNGRNLQRRDSQYVETKEDGKFSFPTQTDPYTLVVLHDQGYLEISEAEIAESTDFTLQPWATVTGKVMVGKNPVAHETVRLTFDRPFDRSQSRINYDYRAVTDSNGTFVFERVPAGRATVGRSMKINDRITTFSHNTSVEAKAGETTSVTIGGMGRPVTGKVLVPDYLKEKFDWRYTEQGLRVNSSEGPYRQLGFKIEADGTFRIDDVPAGDYYLFVNAYERPGERIGMVGLHFDVPEMPNGRSDEPLDLGDLEMDVIGKSDFAPSLAGKPLPDLNDITIDFSLAKAKDEMLLVCFFDVNQRPSRHCINQLAQQAKSLEEKGVAIIAAQASKVEEDTLAEWMKKSKVPFPVGLVQNSEEKTRFTWGVKSLPWLILTDKSHVVSSSGFSLTDLDTEIESAQK